MDLEGRATHLPTIDTTLVTSFKSLSLHRKNTKNRGSNTSKTRFLCDITTNQGILQVLVVVSWIREFDGLAYCSYIRA